MTKQEFLSALEEKLIGLPKANIENCLYFFSEIIDDRMEDGLSEEDAVAFLGSVDEAAEAILREIPLIHIAKEKLKPRRRLKTWETVTLAITSPIWVSLAISVIAVIFALLMVGFALILSLWAVFCALVGSAFGGAVSGFMFLVSQNPLAGIALLGAGLLLAGLSIFWFIGCQAATKGILALATAMAFSIKKRLVGKERSDNE